MYWEFILGLAVISAIISGVIGIYTSSRNNKLEYITKERSEWREEIRLCAEELWDVSYQKTRKICDRLKVRINAFGKRVSNRYSDDSHIWEVIGEIEKDKCDMHRLHQLQSVLQEYLSLLLKWDWERSKREVQGEKLRCIKYIMWVISIIIYAVGLIYEYFVQETQGASENGVTVIGSLLIIALVIVCFLFVDKQMEEVYLIIFVGHVVKKQKKETDLWYKLVNILYFFGVSVVGLVYGMVMYNITRELIGNISDILKMLMLVSICLGVGALISCVLWMGEFIERYYKYARAIDKIRGDLFERQQEDEHLLNE